MASKQYVICVPGLLLKNGTIGKYGDEVTADHVHDLPTRLEEGYIVSKSDFEKEQKDTEAEVDSAKKRRDDLLVKYKDAFKADAPAKASEDQIKKAIDDKKAIIA